ncbi:MAG TPA: acyltransferase [Candidatus Binatia bacterium]|jgi:1-acyl-sn-glycerol-3-phosphate acyltransferase
MLHFLPAFVKIVLGLFVIVANTTLHCVPLFTLAMVKFLVPVPAVRTFLSRALILIAESWIGVNGFTFRLFTKIEWQVEGIQNLRYDGHYLVLSNHQSWVDIPVLQKIFNKRLPFLKFFLKKELIWVPILGLAWWALDFPFMQRHSKELLERRPELKGTDLNTTRRACERFRHVAVSVMNFVEGTRFTEAKRAQQESPYAHLLKPKAGGIAFVLNAMGDILRKVIDVTIVYPGGRPTFLDILSGRLRVVRVFVRELAIPQDLLGGDYENDPAYRARVQAWIAALWVEKDAMITRMLANQAVAMMPTPRR